MSTTTVIGNTATTATARARVATALPDIGALLTSIAQTSPQTLWLIQQGRANDAALTLMEASGPKAAYQFALHTASVMHPVPLGDVTAAVVHALGATTGGRVLTIDQDTALATVMYALGRAEVSPDVYRRAVAPLEQAGADVPWHPAELPDGVPVGPEWDRGCAFRAGYRDATNGDPADLARVGKMYPGHVDAWTAGYDAAKVDQAP